MMADYDSNLIKRIEGLQSITGLNPAKRREERKRRRQFEQEDEQTEEQSMKKSAQPQDMDNTSEGRADNPDNINSERTGIDYCA
jgi:hypothetical protein